MPALSPIRAVILDVDGTVATCPYDFDAMYAAVRRVAEKWEWRPGGAEPRGVVERIAYIAGQLGEQGPGFRAEAEQAVVALELEGAESSRLLPGAAEALAQLRRSGLRLGLITRNCRAAAQRVLERLAGYDVLLAREDVPRVKPDPDHVRQALARLDCPPGHAAVVGDHPFDIQAGRAANAGLCIGVRTGSATDHDLLAAGAQALLDSIAELPGWLLRRERAR